MKGVFEVVPVGHGQYGPFKDENGGPDRFYSWVSLGSTEGGEPVKATLAEGVETPELFKAITVTIELRSGNKLRYHGAVEPAKAVRAA